MEKMMCVKQGAVSKENTGLRSQQIVKEGENPWLCTSQT